MRLFDQAAERMFGAVQICVGQTQHWTMKQFGERLFLCRAHCCISIENYTFEVSKSFLERNGAEKWSGNPGFSVEEYDAAGTRHKGRRNSQACGIHFDVELSIG